MAWPTNKPDSNKFSADTDSIKESRPELNTMSQAVNDIVDFIDTTGIDSNAILIYNKSAGRLEVAEFSASTTITAPDSAGGPFVINASGGISEVVDDTSPELGGDLEVGDFLIKSSQIDSGGESAVKIRILTQPGYRGLFVETDAHTGAPSPQNNSFQLSNNGNIGFTNRSASISMLFNGDAEDDITGAGWSILDSGSHAQTNGGSPGTGVGHQIRANRRDDLQIIAESDKNLSLLASGGTGKIKMYAQYSFPKTDGSNGQVLQTNGSGTLSFATVSAGSETQIAGGDNITVTQPDSAGGFVISQTQLSATLDMNDQQLSNMQIKNFGEIINDLGTTSGTLTPDPNNGSVQKITLNNNLTLNALSNVANGDSITLIVKQDGTGGRTLSSTMKFAGGTKTLSTAANAIDVITIFYDGTDYLASLSTNFS